MISTRGGRTAVGCVGLCAAAMVCALVLAGVPAEATQVTISNMPDALAARDSARGAALVTCLRANTATAPALFRVERAVSGAIPDTFTAYAAPDDGRSGYWMSFGEGQRTVMLLRDAPPPLGPDFARAFHWRHEAQFGVWYSDARDASLNDSAAVALYSGIMKLASLPRREQVSMLGGWIRAGGASLQWSDEVVARHPDVWGEPLRDAYLELSRRDADRLGERAVGRLALHPDTVTRAVFLRLARADRPGWAWAFRLASRDRTPWVRKEVVMLGEKTLASLSGPAPSLGDSRCDWWQGSLTTLHALVESLLPNESEAERRLLVRIAQRATPRHWLRFAALKPLAGDTTAAVRDLIWETVRGDSASLSVSVSGAPEPDQVTAYWTADELHRALMDTSSIVRIYAYKEAGRRRDVRAADTVLVRLRQNRAPGAADIEGFEAMQMIRTLGEAHYTAAFEDLVGWMETTEGDFRTAVMDALQSLGDRRAAAVFRPVARGYCTRLGQTAPRSPEYYTMQMEAAEVADALAALGNKADAELFVPWARECPEIRDAALEAIGLLAGVPRMVEVIRQVEVGPLDPEHARQYEVLESHVRYRMAQRDSAGVR